MVEPFSSTRRKAFDSWIAAAVSNSTRNPNHPGRRAPFERRTGAELSDVISVSERPRPSPATSHDKLEQRNCVFHCVLPGERIRSIMGQSCVLPTCSPLPRKISVRSGFPYFAAFFLCSEPARNRILAGLPTRRRAES